MRRKVVDNYIVLSLSDSVSMIIDMLDSGKPLGTGIDRYRSSRTAGLPVLLPPPPPRGLCAAYFTATTLGLVGKHHEHFWH